jgi:hypothetical protein
LRRRGFLLGGAPFVATARAQSGLFPEWFNARFTRTGADLILWVFDASAQDGREPT